MTQLTVPKISDLVFAVSEMGKITPTLICGLHSQVYDDEDQPKYNHHGQCPLPQGSATLNVSTLANEQACFYNFNDAVAHARARLSDMPVRGRKHGAICEIQGRLAALENRSEELRKRKSKLRQKYYFDRKRYENFYEEDGLSQFVATDLITCDHLPIDSAAFRINTRNWTLEQVRITGIHFWPRFGFQYEFGAFNRSLTSLVFANQDEALDEMAQLFAKSNPGTLRRESVQITTLKQGRTAVEDNQDFFDRSMQHMTRSILQGA